MVNRYKAVSEHLSCDLNGEAVVLNIKNGKYYGLNTVGVTIWEVIQNPSSFEDIKSVILREYEVDDTTCGEEIKSFLEIMKKENLIEVFDE